MANYLTTSVSYGGKDTLEIFYNPLFVGKSPLETKGIKVKLGVKSAIKLNRFNFNTKLLKAYSQGFSGSTGATYTLRTLTVYQMKAEIGQDANVFRDTVLEVLQASGTDWNNLDKAERLRRAILFGFLRSVESDIYRIAWLADTNKETVTGGIYTGTPDTDYNAFDGFFKIIRDNATTTPSGNDNIKLVPMSHGAVAQVGTVTLTGTSGTANITFNGVAYLATFDTDLDTTAGNFVTANAAALLLRGVIVTAPGSDQLVFTSSRAGQPFTAVTVANVSGNLAGTNAATTPNTAPSALAADEAWGYLEDLYQEADIVLRDMPKNMKVFLMDDDSYYNYETSLEVSGSVDGGRRQIIDGIEVLMYRGIMCIKMGWQEHLNADFPTGYPNLIVYTTLENLWLGIDAVSDFSKVEAWYNQDEQENRFRMQNQMGCQYAWGKHTAVSY